MEEVAGGFLVRSVSEVSGDSKKYSYIVIAGPTASGKTSLSLRLAQEWNGEIISCDSVQVYKGFDIGSAKPSIREQKLVPHHLIDIVSCHEDYDAGRYAKEARQKISELSLKGKLPIVVGGTGLYLKAMWGQGFHQDLPQDERLRESLNQREAAELFQELKTKDPKRAQEIHPNDKYRIVRALELIELTGMPVSEMAYPSREQDPNAFVILLDPPRAKLHEQIHLRVKQMLKDGLVEEVKGLLKNLCGKESKPMQSIGYKEVVSMLDGEIHASDLENEILFATRQYAKRQVTWFKKVKGDLRLSDPTEIPDRSQLLKLLI